MKWLKSDSKNATIEGWDLYDSEGSQDGCLQIQRNDEQNKLDSDEQAWKIVLNGTEKHHKKALKLIKNKNIAEYERVINCQK
jgi:hypothetical protein